MKNFISIALVFVISIPLLFTFGTLVDYEINKAHYIKDLCEKREIEDNSCQGNCALSKKLASVKTSENQTTNKVVEIVGIEFFGFNTSIQSVIPVFTDQLKTKFSLHHCTAILQDGFLQGVFHPPQFKV